MLKFITILSLLFSFQAFAKSTTPARCASDTDLNEIYTYDYLSRMDALDRFWRAYGGCSKIDTFWNFSKLPVIDLRYSVPEEACGYSGTVNATKDFLWEVRRICNIDCYDKGFGFGELVGDYFCSIASAPEDLRDCLPDSGIEGVFCSARGQTSCNLGYDSKSRATCEFEVTTKPRLHMDLRMQSCLIL